MAGFLSPTVFLLAFGIAIGISTNRAGYSKRLRSFLKFTYVPRKAVLLHIHIIQDISVAAYQNVSEKREVTHTSLCC